MAGLCPQSPAIARTGDSVTFSVDGLFVLNSSELATVPSMASYVAFPLPRLRSLRSTDALKICQGWARAEHKARTLGRPVTVQREPAYLILKLFLMGPLKRNFPPERFNQWTKA